MKNPELWDKTVSILVKAYLNNTLQHSLCQACAVGNIVAANNKMETCGNLPCGDYVWSNVTRRFRFGLTTDNESYERGLIHIQNTGYSIQNIVDIECAFEGVIWVDNKDDYIFNGLMSVIDTLMQIHEATPTEAQEAKSLFTKELAV